MKNQHAVSVCAIVLSYNAREALTSALRSLKQSTQPLDILVVDNHSDEDPRHFLPSQFPGIFLERAESNKGFSGGMNAGIRWALKRNYDYIWLINQDVQIMPETLSSLLIVALQSPRNGFLSPVIKKPNGTAWFLGGEISYGRMRAMHRRALPQATPYESEYLTGCALFLSRALIEEIGLLDEGYFLYYEDAEYSLRARKSGFIPKVVPAAQVIHAEQSLLRKDTVYWLVRSGIRFFRRESPWYWRPWIAVFIFLRRLKNAGERYFRPSETASLVARAYTDASRNNQ